MSICWVSKGGEGSHQGKKKGKCTGWCVKTTRGMRRETAEQRKKLGSKEGMLEEEKQE